MGLGRGLGGGGGLRDRGGRSLELLEHQLRLFTGAIAVGELADGELKEGLCLVDVLGYAFADVVGPAQQEGTVWAAAIVRGLQMQRGGRVVHGRVMHGMPWRDGAVDRGQAGWWRTKDGGQQVTRVLSTLCHRAHRTLTPTTGPRR